MVDLIPSKYFANGHTAMNAPDPIRTRKLSIARPGQYWGGGPPGKPFGCRWLFALRVFDVEKTSLHFSTRTRHEKTSLNFSTRNTFVRKKNFVTLFDTHSTVTRILVSQKNFVELFDAHTVSAKKTSLNFSTRNTFVRKKKLCYTFRHALNTNTRVAKKLR